MQEYGKHTKEVMEVVNFIRSGGILKTEFQEEKFSDYDVKLIYILDEDKIDKYIDPDADNAEIVEYMWSDIVEDNEIDYRYRDSHFKKEIWPKINALSIELFNELSDQLKHLINEEFIEVIAEDIDNILTDRASAGIIPDSMQEKFYRVYQASGIPIGWSGEYPEGKLVVYSK